MNPIPNLRVTRESYDVGWGSVTIVMATLALIKALADEKNLECILSPLISGENILIKLLKDLERRYRLLINQKSELRNPESRFF